ncbi:hypothetical protein B841_09555 [Corynebacterium maris DSM 45190]|uniref:D-inositol 3-phosphate glycosyltransferase n=1 Tax=Corynebacterium maris DSM 45190 TaxID=1224163 RepID=S5TL02_9CORY|nr:hypothetical protein B841_09555 [Corynebacterium maris DSM 45190]
MLEAFAGSPSAGNLESALRYLWDDCGEIDAAYGLLDENRELTVKFSGSSATMVKRIEGAWRLRHQGLLIPERSTDCAYFAEPGRVMYTVHSSPVYNSNGYSTRTKGVAEGMKSASVDVVVVARTGYPWDSTIDGEYPQAHRTVTELNGVTYVHTPGGDLNHEPLDHYFHQAADAFVREARLNRPQLIQSASNHRTALAALVAARRVGVPFVYEVRGLWEVTEASSKEGFVDTERYEEQRRLENVVAQEADLVLAITPQIADELVQRGVDRDRIVLAPNAVDPEAFLPLPKDADFARAKGIDPDLPAIGFAGSFVSYEGLNVLLSASKLLDQRGIKHQIALAGSGPVEKDLRWQVADEKIRNVHFLGRLPNQDMPRLYSTFDIVACPRLSQPVTELVSPLKPLESFAAATATVVSDVAPNLVLAGKSEERALVCRSGDAESLADALQRLIENRDLRMTIARAGRLWTVRERNWCRLGTIIADAHETAHENYRTVAAEGRDLSDVRVGLIADEFTTATITQKFTATPVGRRTWREQIAAERIDLLFVESAWHGNDDDWHRGVGHYSDEESSDLRALVEECRNCGIPTVFWNKEDPVHFKRFAPNAAWFDHVFTTDAAKIPDYLATVGHNNLTVSALPFWAEPKIHNPLGTSRKFSSSVAYAGTYYGERYAERSQRLLDLLTVAEPYGLDLYDRQAHDPDSLYRFPDEFQQYVRGSLPYDEVIDAYKSHLTNINVNSVTESPTMYSRRVIEIAASGGVVLSSEGRGIEETLGSAIATTADPKVAWAWLSDWAQHPEERVREIWLQMRTVYRSHTSDTALAILCRTVGISARGIRRPRVMAHIEGILSADRACEIAAQSLRPLAVHCASFDDDAKDFLTKAGIDLVEDAELASESEWVLTIKPNQRLARTHTEDLFLATRFGDWDAIGCEVADGSDSGRPVAESTDAVGPGGVLMQAGEFNQYPDRIRGNCVRLLIAPPTPGTLTEIEAVDEGVGSSLEGKTVLMVGHDFKFTGDLRGRLEREGARVLIDKWDGHNQHDEEHSKQLLAQADVIFCEWGLGNAVWYSRHVSSEQRLVVRVHLQEINLPYLTRMDHGSVSSYVFVGELIRAAAVTSHGVPEEKTTVVPNLVDTAALARPKLNGADHNIGIVGIVPQRKRLDLALDLLEKLLAADENFTLHIKGKRPSEYAWMKARDQESEYYKLQYERIDDINAQFPGAVIFDGFGDDMAEWYREIGHVISVSDFESFHLTIADGAASGATPASLAWDGADLIYPDTWLAADLEELANLILDPAHRDKAPQFIEDNFGQDAVLDQLVRELT